MARPKIEPTKRRDHLFAGRLNDGEARLVRRAIDLHVDSLVSALLERGASAEAARMAETARTVRSWMLAAARRDVERAGLDPDAIMRGNYPSEERPSPKAPKRKTEPKPRTGQG